MLPPNELTPGQYRGRIKELAKEHGWRREVFDYSQLRKWVRVRSAQWPRAAKPRCGNSAPALHALRAKRTAAVVGKGICFDTGGHNLKPARYMYAMHEDMNGSAVALGIMVAATDEASRQSRLLARDFAQRHQPRAYHQNEVVRAFNGTTIEVMHTDAEGRMVLADTLTLAARAKPDLIIDFATLTGTMHSALGERYSGIFATSDELGAQAVAAGRLAGERVCVFPQDDDYDSALDSKIADVKQCSLDAAADHILATRFLKRFVGNTPWIHVDLSASSAKGGLGAVASDTTGFGVAGRSSCWRRS